MKKHLAPYLLGLLAAVSCGTSAQFAAGTQQFEDGIYADPRSEAPVAAVSQDDMDALVKESIESEVYVLSASGDTVVVPEGKVAKLRFDGNVTDITVVNNYGWDYDWGYSWAYRPWYLRGYYSPWYYSSWSYWDPWYWESWYYRPWRHYGYYSPWSWGWYDPWYYSSWYYDPWYWGPSYYGWYGYG